MGADPFWPSYLASVNVLCVPAATISPRRFAEVFGSLKTVQEIKTAELDLDSDARTGLLAAPLGERMGVDDIQI